MKEIRTTFYELRSYFIPGSFVVWAILELMCLNGYEPITKAAYTFSMTMKGVLFIILSYIVGHTLHVFANFTIDKLPFGSYPPSDYFNSRFENDFSPEVINSLYISLNEISGITHASKNNINEIIRKGYWICFQYVMNSGNTETENILGLTGFYRGITSAMMVISTIYIISFTLYTDFNTLFIFFLSTIVGFLFLTRVKRFNYYLAKTVYSNFLYIYKEKQSK
jgi:hypothetical protein